jgi:hypothetical protein
MCLMSNDTAVEVGGDMYLDFLEEYPCIRVA